MKISNETKVGIFVIIGLTVLIIGYNYLKGSDIFKRSKVIYVVYDDVKGLGVSSQVFMNGLDIGRVTHLDFMSETSKKILTRLDVRRNVKIPENTIARLFSPDLLGTKAIELEIPDDESQRVYVLIDAELHQRAMTALQQQQDWESIQEGIAQADAGDSMPLAEADRRIREEFGFPAQT